MRVVIDMQGAQVARRRTETAHYLLPLVKEMARQRVNQETIIALNGVLIDSIEQIRIGF